MAIKSSGVRITDNSSIQTQDVPFGKKYPRYVSDDINRAEKHKQYFSFHNVQLEVGRLALTQNYTPSINRVNCSVDPVFQLRCIGSFQKAKVTKISCLANAFLEVDE